MPTIDRLGGMRVSIMVAESFKPSRSPAWRALQRAEANGRTGRTARLAHGQERRQITGFIALH